MFICIGMESYFPSRCHQYHIRLLNPAKGKFWSRIQRRTMDELLLTSMKDINTQRGALKQRHQSLNQQHAEISILLHTHNCSFMPPPRCENIAYKGRKRKQHAEQAHWTQRLPGSEQHPERPESLL